MRLKYLFLFTTLAFTLSACINRRDAMAPMITIVSPANGTADNADNITVYGYAMDDEGIRAIRVGNNDLLESDFYSVCLSNRTAHRQIHDQHCGRRYLWQNKDTTL
jgi:hypothetical protein